MGYSVAIGLAALLVAPAMGFVGTATGEPSGLKIGTNLSSVDKLKSLGAKPDYGLFWVGIWTKDDWGSVDRQLNSAKSKGVTPVIQWYYWGDDISPTCVEKGCYSSLHGGWKSKSDWNAMASTLSKKIRSVMGDRQTIVILETEFNKQGVQSYEPFDGYLAAQAQTFRTNAPNAKLILGLGNWGYQYYKNFDRAAAKVHYIGTQELLGSTRDSDSAYYSGVSRLVDAGKRIRATFGKPCFITDTGFSSYPASKYEAYQERLVKEMFNRLDELESAGCVAWMYRSVFDNPTMNTANYYGMAERYWGFIRSDGSWKPAMNDYIAGIKAVHASAPAARSAPGYHEAETFRTRTTGSSFYDGAASADRAWGLWSNGHVEDAVVASSGGKYAFEVKARGSIAAGEWPQMVLSVGGQEVGRWSVSSTSYRTYTGHAWLSDNQAKSVRISFVNDRYADGQDRNLIVDAVRVYRAASGSLEAESMAYKTTGGRVSDGDASGNAAWNVWSNGHVRDSFEATAAGKYALAFRMKGTWAAGGAPVAVAYVDGTEVGRWTVTSTDWSTYRTTSPWLAQGWHGVRVNFVNDYYANGQDRNLLVDSVSWSLT